jgi:hypothetical protein
MSAFDHRRSEVGLSHSRPKQSRQPIAAGRKPRSEQAI